MDYPLVEGFGTGICLWVDTAGESSVDFKELTQLFVDSVAEFPAVVCDENAHGPEQRYPSIKNSRGNCVGFFVGQGNGTGELGEGVSDHQDPLVVCGSDFEGTEQVCMYSLVWSVRGVQGSGGS